jgi:hypothetical protein
MIDTDIYNLIYACRRRPKSVRRCMFACEKCPGQEEYDDASGGSKEEIKPQCNLEQPCLGFSQIDSSAAVADVRE